MNSEFISTVRIEVKFYASWVFIQSFILYNDDRREENQWIRGKSMDQMKTTMGEYVKGPHTLTKRRLTCHECGKTSMCKHRIVK